MTIDTNLSQAAARNDAESIRVNNLAHHFGVPEGARGEITYRGSSDPADAVDGWLNSPGHRKIMLDPSQTSMGISMNSGYATAVLA